MRLLLTSGPEFWLFTLYDKDEAADLTPKERAAPKERVKAELRARSKANWEQGRASPNAQAALLIRLVQRYPDTVERLAQI